MALAPQAQETFTRLFGAPAQPHPTDPELYEILQNQIFGEGFSTGVLNDVEREIITVTALGCLQTLPQLRAHAAAALNVGATPLQLREALYQCAPYIGYPRALNAVAALDEVLTEQGIELPLPDAATVAPDDAEARHSAGAAIQEPLYGSEIKEVLASLPAPFDAAAPELVTTACFGDYYSRGVLTIAEREIIGLVAITAIGATAQLGAHIAGAVRAGNSLERVTAALVQALPYVGGPRAMSALVLVARYDESASHEAYR